MDLDISHPSQKRPATSAPSPFKKAKTTVEPVVNNPLMDLFVGKKIFITTEMTDYYQIRRYVIALVTSDHMICNNSFIAVMVGKLSMSLKEMRQLM